MPDHRRNRVPGGTFFFTVNLLDRRSDLLVTQIDALRDAVRRVRARAPFHIDAWVVLPDHMHCLWTPASAGAGDYRKAIATSPAVGARSSTVGRRPIRRRPFAAEGASAFPPYACCVGCRSRQQAVKRKPSFCGIISLFERCTFVIDAAPRR